MTNENEFTFQTFLKTDDKHTVLKYVAHASVMISINKRYSLDDATITNCGKEFLVTFKNLTEKQFRQVSSYFYAVEFTFSMK